MLALIMAGGEGSRLNLGEKPLVTIAGRPMIAHVIRAFELFGCHVVVVASGKTPMTQNWCRVTGIDLFQAAGTGYIDDMIEAVVALDERQPIFVAVSDLPCLNTSILETIYSAYRNSRKDACSTWVPLSLVKNHHDIQYVDKIDGVDACPCGVNILRGDRISVPQDECRILLHEQRVAYNVNTRSDLAIADAFLKGVIG
ncbi:MAG: NTP transferase domain-containing protein [Methanoregula sp.]|nr:NTP transferase domain-containing protein [Methanoregula sp.]